MDSIYGFKTDRQRYHSTTSSNLFLRKLANADAVNSFILRIAWSVFLWNSHKMEVAKVIAEVIHKNIQPDMPLHNDTEQKNKNIGYSDYTD